MSVPATGKFDLNGGKLDLAQTDLHVGGAASLGAGRVDNARHVDILSSGQVSGDSGTITLFGNWLDAGLFNPGSSQVNFVDGNLAQSSITGTTIFANASFVSSVGKSYSFQTGTTQTIGNVLQIHGTSAVGIQFKSDTAGQAAFLDLLDSGSQDIAYVGVSSVHAVGQWLAPLLTNDGGLGDALRWFCGYLVPCSIEPTKVVAAPALSEWGILLTLLGIIGVAIPARSWISKKAHPTSTDRGY